VNAKKVFKNLPIISFKGDYEKEEIVHIETNSSHCVKGTIYVCTKGVNADSHNFAQDAKLNGASILVVERYVDCDLPQVLVENSRQALSILSSNFFNNSNEKLRIIGITGTNGKTTSSFVTKQILEIMNKKVGLIGTEGVWIGSDFYPGELTTPDPFDLHKIFAKMVEDNCEFCVMEVSAHAIALSKICGIKFEVGLLTNITQDHLDYFLTMERYAKTKIDFLLGEQVEKLILNSDDPRYSEISAMTNKKFVSYGRENPADIFCTEPEYKPSGTTYFVNAFDEVCRVDTPLCGDYNVSNALGVVSICLSFGLKLEDICSALKKTKPVAGRFNIVELDPKRYVVIDFAHTPDGIEKILQATKKIFPSPIIALFGASGNRDRGKRAIMGKIAEENADFLVITSDNPRYEKPEFIIYEICKGLKKTNHILIPDRRVAVAIALEYLSEGGTLVLCGKGAEKYQDINGIKQPYNDLNEVEKFVESEKDKKNIDEALQC